MPYRSERFEAGEQTGITQAWSAIDELESQGLQIRTEVMAGKSYRRQLEPHTRLELGDPDYVIQAVLSVPLRADGVRVSARDYINESRKTLLDLELPGRPYLDQGGLHGLDPATTELAFESTGDTTEDILYIYSPWTRTKWTEAGKKCLFYCGIEPPKPQRLMEEHRSKWPELLMRKGFVMFNPCPFDLRTY